jgi:formylglycine-generating enzyme required for sulfatase activity
MDTLQHGQKGRKLLFALSQLATLTTLACTVAPFMDGQDGGIGVSPLDGSSQTAPTVNTECGTARVDETSNAVDVCIAGGQFEMGTSADNLGGTFSDHSPPHAVTLSAYFIDAYEVTVGRYGACVAADACEAPASTGAGCTYKLLSSPSGALPVDCVTYSAAASFCLWDGNRRLPTEAEWERAARGSSSNNYPWGDGFSCSQAVTAATTTCLNFSPQQPATVGSMPTGKSAEGVYDLVGNVAEWVSDWAGSYPNSSVTNPTGPAVGTQRVVRGGDWVTPANQTFAYLRRSSMPANAGTLGFRCARGAD